MLSKPFFNKCALLDDGENDLELEEEEDEEQLYELASLPNGEMSDISSEAEGGQGEEQLRVSDGDEKDGDGGESEETFQRGVVEDIRFVAFRHGRVWGSGGAALTPRVSSAAPTGKVSLASGWS